MHTPDKHTERICELGLVSLELVKPVMERLLIGKLCFAVSNLPVLQAYKR